MAETPFLPFRFRVVLYSGDQAPDLSSEQSLSQLFCAGAFSEVSGLEATMTPRAVKEGGRNVGELQRVGPTAFGTVVLKRGITSLDHLWVWFDVVTGKANYGYRMNGVVEVWDQGGASGTPRLRFKLENALPVKFKGPDLSAQASEVAVEELHIVHEGLTLERPT